MSPSEPPAPPGTVELAAERFAAGGEAIAHGPDGRIVFVRGAVPGDAVAVEITDERDAWMRGVVDRVLAASDDRVEPPCPQRRAGCGGCDWQHLEVSAQLAAKADVVRDALRRTARMPDAAVSVGAAVPAEGYRTTIRVVGAPDRRPAFRRERAHDTVGADGCLVAHPLLRGLLDRVRLDPELELTLRVSAATGEMTARWDRGGGRVDGLPDHVGTGARAVLHEDVNGHRLRVSAGSFFQSGPEAAELLVAAVRRAAPELVTARTVVDAYAGVGLFAVAATPAAARVVAIESSRSSVDDARANLSGRDALVELCQVGRWRVPDEPIDVVIADPARSGLGRPGTATLVGTGAPVITLVSCDPVAMARDAALLDRSGYRHAGTEVLDLFPHTHHVECVTRFERAD